MEPSPPARYSGSRHPLSIARFVRGHTQATLSKDSGVARSTISELEHGRTPTLRVARAIAAVLGVGLDEIFPSNSEAPAANQGSAKTRDADSRCPA